MDRTCLRIQTMKRADDLSCRSAACRVPLSDAPLFATI